MMPGTACLLTAKKGSSIFFREHAEGGCPSEAMLAPRAGRAFVRVSRGVRSALPRPGRSVGALRAPQRRAHALAASSPLGAAVAPHGASRDAGAASTASGLLVTKAKGAISARRGRVSFHPS